MTNGLSGCYTKYMNLTDLLGKAKLGYQTALQNLGQNQQQGSVGGIYPTPSPQMNENRPFVGQMPNVPQMPQVTENGGDARVQDSRFRLPQWEQWSKQNPKGFEELLSGTGLASEKWGVPQDLMMDIAGLETSGGQFMNQVGGGPGQGWFQFEPDTLEGLLSQIDPNSATESADLVGQLISEGQLSRWGGPKRRWGTLDNQRRPESDRLSTYYSPEEINPYLRDDMKF